MSSAASLGLSPRLYSAVLAIRVRSAVASSTSATGSCAVDRVPSFKSTLCRDYQAARATVARLLTQPTSYSPDLPRLLKRLRIAGVVITSAIPSAATAATWTSTLTGERLSVAREVRRGLVLLKAV